jgi:hypothetical protein
MTTNDTVARVCFLLALSTAFVGAGCKKESPTVFMVGDKEYVFIASFPEPADGKMFGVISRILEAHDLEPCMESDVRIVSISVPTGKVSEAVKILKNSPEIEKMGLKIWWARGI